MHPFEIQLYCALLPKPADFRTDNINIKLFSTVSNNKFAKIRFLVLKYKMKAKYVKMCFILFSLSDSGPKIQDQRHWNGQACLNLKNSCTGLLHLRMNLIIDSCSSRQCLQIHVDTNKKLKFFEKLFLLGCNSNFIKAPVERPNTKSQTHF